MIWIIWMEPIICQKKNNYLKKKLCENLKYKIVTNCTSNKNMSDTAFQIYHAELNHIDDICFYIQSNEWNKRTEENVIKNKTK